MCYAPGSACMALRFVYFQGDIQLESNQPDLKARKVHNCAGFGFYD